MRICYAPGVLMRENAMPLLFLWITLGKKKKEKKRALPLLFVFLLEESLKQIALADLQELRLKQ